MLFGGMSVVLGLSLMLVVVVDVLIISNCLLFIGGVLQIEGLVGGGFMLWVVIVGYGICDEIGVIVFVMCVNVQDYYFNDVGVVVGFYDWVEFLVVQ